MTAAVLGLVGVALGVVGGALLGYWYRKREHLRELRVDRYADLMDAASEHQRVLFDTSRDYIHGADRVDEATRSSLDEGSGAFGAAYSRFLFVGSAETAPIASRLRTGLLDLHNLLLRGSELNESEQRTRMEALLELRREFQTHAARELWGRQVPAPKDRVSDVRRP